MTESLRRAIVAEQREVILDRISRERDRQDDLFPAQAPGGLDEPTNAELVAILVEEVGEVAREVLEGREAELHTELIQTAAVCVKFVEILNTRAQMDRTLQELGFGTTDGESEPRGRK